MSKADWKILKFHDTYYAKRTIPMTSFLSDTVVYLARLFLRTTSIATGSMRHKNYYWVSQKIRDDSLFPGSLKTGVAGDNWAARNIGIPDISCWFSDFLFLKCRHELPRTTRHLNVKYQSWYLTLKCQMGSPHFGTLVNSVYLLWVKMQRLNKKLMQLNRVINESHMMKMSFCGRS